MTSAEREESRDEEDNLPEASEQADTFSPEEE